MTFYCITVRDASGAGALLPEYRVLPAVSTVSPSDRAVRNQVEAI